MVVSLSQPTQLLCSMQYAFVCILSLCVDQDEIFSGRSHIAVLRRRNAMHRGSITDTSKPSDRLSWIKVNCVITVQDRYTA